MVVAPKLLDRYAVREFLGPFVVCVIGFTILLISGYLFELTDLIFVKRVAVTTVLQLLWYKLPSVVTLTLPVGVLFATFLSLGRLTRDNELTVMRCAGHSFARFVVPYLILGLVISFVAFLANDRLVPYSNHQEATIIRQLVLQEALPAVEERVFFKDPDDRFFYIDRVNRRTKQLSDVMVYLPNSQSRYPTLVTAKWGEYEDFTWRLRDGVQREFDSDGFIAREVGFADLEIVTKQQAEVFLGKQKTTEEMTRAELREHIDLFQRSGIKVDAFVVDYHLKLALPFASLVFALLAAPFSFRTGRSGRFAGIIVSLAIMFLYYVVTSVARSMGANGMLPTTTAAWIGNVAFTGIGVLAVFWVERW